LWNLQTRDWDVDLLEAFSIDAEQLPKPVPSAFEYGNVKKFNYPLVLVNGDQNSAVYGYGKLDSNTSFVNMGTGAFVLAKNNRQPVLNSKLLASITYSSDKKQEYALEGTVNGAGAAMTWAENEWNINDIESISWENVEHVPIFLNTVGGLGSPYWRSDIAPAFLDAKSTHTDYSNEQRVAALMESIVFLLAINIEEMRKHEVETKQLLVAGGLSKDDHLCQCLADVCSASVTVSNFKEATSRGAAWLAFQAPGQKASDKNILGKIQPDWGVLDSKQFHPTENSSLQSRFEVFKDAIYQRLH
jgi:glycerol kinase